MRRPLVACQHFDLHVISPPVNVTNTSSAFARAKTVQAYLKSLGVKSAASVAQGKGKRDPVSKDCTATASREQQIVCLQPDRRVTIEVTGVAR